ncbi:MAG: polysaccharide pyruvyl transferase family protein [Methanosphaera sp.]|nr:polysaccharide pyruvyl transferase family protein [Methanosphaera sp.]
MSRTTTQPCTHRDVELVRIFVWFAIGLSVNSNNDVVGINISNIAMGLGETRKQLLKSYEETIDFILNDTDMDILFIPHVYASQKKESLLFRQNKDYDTDVIDLLYFQYKNNTRVHKVEQFFNAKELKSIISQCRFIITARTHISIASYSSFVPTLVVGRAIKAFGLAESLFGTSENFVYDSSVVEHSKSLKDCFLYIYQNEKNIRHQLELSVPNLKMLNEESIKDVTLKLGNLI